MLPENMTLMFFLKSSCPFYLTAMAVALVLRHGELTSVNMCGRLQARDEVNCREYSLKT